MSEIKRKTVLGILWETIGRFASLFIQLGITIIIARILTPADYGTIGLLTVFVAVADIIVDSGFSTALIQKEEITDTETSTVFFLNLIIGFILYLLLCMGSPFIAEFYGIPELQQIANILFLIIPINSLGLIQNVIIRKKLLFKISSVANILSSLLSGVIGIILAYSGFRITALVFQQLSMAAFRTLLYIVLCRWRPHFVFSFSCVKTFFAYSMNLMCNSLIHTIMSNIYTLVIGKYFSASQVGYYNQAKRFEVCSSSTLTTVVVNVSFPVLAGLKDDIQRTREAYKKIMCMTSFMVMPLMILLIAVARPFIVSLLTDKWVLAVPYLQILCVYGLLLPIVQISHNIYKLYLKSGQLLIIEVIKHITFVLSMIFTIKYGISVLLWGQVLVIAVVSMLHMHFSGKLLGFSVFDQIKNIAPPLIISGMCGILLAYIPTHQSDVVTLCSHTAIFIVGYILLCLLFRLPALVEFAAILKSHLLHRND